LRGRSEPIIYGEDGREELFEVDDEALRATVEQSLVTLVPKEWVRFDRGQVQISAPSQAELAGVCPGERFAKQPAAALCSGVLVDWDLVLTAEHCVHAVALEDLVVVFGYFYDSAGHLQLAPEDVFEPSKVLVEERVSREGSTVLDYAWLKLDRPVQWPRRPVAIRGTDADVVPGMPIVSAGTSGGLPIKVDRGASIRSYVASGEREHFIASSDTARGGSGGAALDSDLVLLGVLFAGGTDLRVSSDCLLSNHADEPDGSERYVFAHRALTGLCDEKPKASSLCREGCGDPCEALPLPEAPRGCALIRANDASDAALGFALLAWMRRRRASAISLRGGAKRSPRC
jgi:hypothetical protein